MKVEIKYIAIDPLYSDQEQTFIGMDQESVDQQILNFEDYLGKEYCGGFEVIYKREIMSTSEDYRNYLFIE